VNRDYPLLPGESEQHRVERMEWEQHGPSRETHGDPSDTVDCPECGGTGANPYVRTDVGGYADCDRCDGAGWIFHGEL
jgi:hypothetical protein